MKKGFMLVELLIAITIFVIALAAVLSLYFGCIISNESNRKLMLAYLGVQTKMEEIKSHGFDSLITDYNGAVFDLNGFITGEGKGKVTVTSIAADRVRVTIYGCFKVRNRTFGDSIDNCTTSPVELVTEITK